MLKKSREEIMNNLVYKLENDLNNIHCEGWNHYKNGSHFYQIHDAIDNEPISAPGEASGWPPGILSLIKLTALATATTILDAVYNEKELEDKVERIMLEDQKTENNVQP